MAMKIVILEDNADAAIGMKSVLRVAGWAVKRILPFDDMCWIEIDWFRAM